MRIHARACRGQGTATAKATKQEHAWCVREITRGQCGCSRVNKGEKERSAVRKKGLKGHDQDFGFSLSRMGGLGWAQTTGRQVIAWNPVRRRLWPLRKEGDAGSHQAGSRFWIFF